MHLVVFVFISNECFCTFLSLKLHTYKEDFLKELIHMKFLILHVKGSSRNRRTGQGGDASEPGRSLKHCKGSSTSRNAVSGLCDVSFAGLSVTRSHPNIRTDWQRNLLLRICSCPKWELLHQGVGVEGTKKSGGKKKDKKKKIKKRELKENTQKTHKKAHETACRVGLEKFMS